MFEVEVVMQTSNSQARKRARKRARIIVVTSVDKEQLFMMKKNPVDLTVAGFPVNSTAVFTSVCSLLGNFHGLLSSRKTSFYHKVHLTLKKAWHSFETVKLSFGGKLPE